MVRSWLISKKTYPPKTPLSVVIKSPETRHTNVIYQLVSGELNDVSKIAVDKATLSVRRPQKCSTMATRSKYVYVKCVQNSNTVKKG